MKLFLAGDYRTGTGPANVTKYYIENLPKGSMHQKATSKPARLIEIVFNTLRADTVLYSGYSKQNIIGLKLAKRLGKKTAYLMHGCVEHENKINREVDDTMNRVERQTMALADRVFAVSPSFENWLKINYPEYSEKITHVTNAIDEHIRNCVTNNSAADTNDNQSEEKDPKCDTKSAQADEENRDKNMVLTIGGGMPRKQILKICEAIKRINDIQGRSLRLVVIGDKGADTDAINEYSFVENLGIVPFDKTCELMKKAGVFVQNSCFETFGLAPIEAISMGTSTLMSKEVGALCLFSDLHIDDIIYRYDDVAEIADKIDFLLEHPNAKRLLEGIDVKNNTWSIRCEELISKLSQI